MGETSKAKVLLAQILTMKIRCRGQEVIAKLDRPEKPSPRSSVLGPRSFNLSLTDIEGEKVPGRN
jgi:hypothetical protein